MEMTTTVERRKHGIEAVNYSRDTSPCNLASNDTKNGTSQSEGIRSIVNDLVSYRKGGEPSKNFCKAAVGSLCKKLKNKPGELKNLLSILKSKGQEPSPCITIRRPANGALQFEGWRDSAHMIYIKIWRWPEVLEKEVTHIGSCHYGFDRKFTSICVNPYHYTRVSSSDSTMQGTGQCRILHWNPVLNLVTSPERTVTSATLSGTIDHPYKRIALPETEASCSPRNPLNRVAPAEILPDLHVESNHCVMPISVTNSRLDGAIPMQPPQNEGQREFLRYIQWSNIQMINRADEAEPPARHWCSINYYEHDIQVGPSFKAPSTNSCVKIDGYVEMSSEYRFCLGVLTNLQRTRSTQSIRNRIGEGIELELRDSGDIWLSCLADYSVFVQSFYLDTITGRAGDVHQIQPHTCLKIFDFQYFHSEIQVQIADEEALVPQGQRYPSLSADKLSNFCKFRLSFLTGWSSGYPWESIELTPCWIEVHVHQALQVLDGILRKKSSQCITHPVRHQEEHTSAGLPSIIVPSSNPGALSTISPIFRCRFCDLPFQTLAKLSMHEFLIHKKNHNT